MFRHILWLTLLFRISLAFRLIEDVLRRNQVARPPDSQITQPPALPLIKRAPSPVAEPEPNLSILLSGKLLDIGAMLGAGTDGEGPAGLSGASVCVSAGIPEGPGITWCGGASIFVDTNGHGGWSLGPAASTAVAAGSAAGCDGAVDDGECASFASAVGRAALGWDTAFTNTGNAPVPTGILAAVAGNANAQPPLTVAAAISLAQPTTIAISAGKTAGDDTFPTSLPSSLVIGNSWISASIGPDGVAVSVPFASASAGPNGAGAGVGWGNNDNGDGDGDGTSSTTSFSATSTSSPFSVVASGGVTSDRCPGKVISIAIWALPALGGGILLWL